MVFVSCLPSRCQRHTKNPGAIQGWVLGPWLFVYGTPPLAMLSKADSRLLLSFSFTSTLPHIPSFSSLHLFLPSSDPPVLPDSLILFSSASYVWRNSNPEPFRTPDSRLFKLSVRLPLTSLRHLQLRPVQLSFLLTTAQSNQLSSLLFSLLSSLFRVWKGTRTQTDYLSYSLLS